jgi:Ca2+-binding RTX toxin-like protein
VGDYWIGAAPTKVPEKAENTSNVSPLAIGAKPSNTSFGIYKKAAWDKLGNGPDLVAHVSLVGGLTLDTSLSFLVDAAPSGALKSGVFVPVGDEENFLLGWGQFYKLEGTDFAKQYVNALYTQSASNANLAELVRFGNDSMVGDEKANVLNGYNGNDTLLGGAGNDVLLGGNGNDSLLGQDGVDYIVGGLGSDILDAGGFDGDVDDLFGGTGNDTYYVYEDSDSVVEQAGEGLADLTVALYDDHELVDNVENLLLGLNVVSGYGNDGANFLTGNSINNSLFGGSGNDTLEGKGTNGVATDTLAGGLGDDYYIVDSALDRITEDGTGTDTVLTAVSFDLSNTLVNGGTGVENLIYSGTGDVSLTGNALANTITGRAGNDTLDGGSLAGGIGDNIVDSLIGGNGDDFYVFRVNSGLDVIYDTMGTDAVLAYGDFDLQALNIGLNNPTTIENLQQASVTGALYGNSLNNVITGNSGNDTLDGREGVDTLSGGTGNDYYIVDSLTDYIQDAGGTGDSVIASLLSSFDLSNTLVGGGSAIEHLFFTGASGATLTGNINANSIIGGAGIDLMTGGKGNDTYFVTAGDTVIEDTLEGGIDLVISSESYSLGENIEYLLLDGAESISGTGNSGANTITGNSGANSINGGAGIDSLIGGAGDDTYFVDDIGDEIYEVAGADVDTVVSRFNGYALGDNLEHLVLASGVAGVFNGSGNDLNNSLAGNSFSNNLFGGAGNDTLTGSRTRGNGEIDTMRGGVGNDVFVLGDASNAYYTASAETDYVLIEDFNNTEDRLQIKSTEADYTLGGVVDGYQSITITSSAELIAKFKNQGAQLDWGDITTIPVG